MTHTYVVLELSPAAYDEIAGKLKAAAYDHAFGDDGEIDMHGIAVKREPETMLDARDRRDRDARDRVTRETEPGGLTIGPRSFERRK